MRVPVPRTLIRRCTYLLGWALVPCSAGAEVEFAWPLALEHALSSTFGETRPAAFHAGIDLKTQGKTGFEVHAPAAGYLWKVRTSPWGYGRSLYQKLPDGRLLVYAHLQGFAPLIAARVVRAQREKQAYSVDLEFQPGEVPIVFLYWAIVSGIALMSLIYMGSTLLRRRTIDMACVDKLTYFLFYALIIDFSLEMLDFIHRLYTSEESIHILAQMISSKLFISLIVLQVSLGTLAPRAVLALVCPLTERGSVIHTSARLRQWIYLGGC